MYKIYIRVRERKWYGRVKARKAYTWKRRWIKICDHCLLNFSSGGSRIGCIANVSESGLLCQDGWNRRPCSFWRPDLAHCTWQILSWVALLHPVCPRHRPHHLWNFTTGDTLTLNNFRRLVNWEGFMDHGSAFNYISVQNIPAIIASIIVASLARRNQYRSLMFRGW